MTRDEFIAAIPSIQGTQVEIMFSEPDAETNAHHVVAMIRGSGKAVALQCAQAVLDVVRGKRAFVRVPPEAESQRDFSSGKWTHKGYVRFAFMDEPGEWMTSDAYPRSADTRSWAGLEPRTVTTVPFVPDGRPFHVESAAAHIAAALPPYEWRTIGRTLEDVNYPIDPMVLPLVVALRERRIETLGSCQGHECADPDWSYPWVTVHGRDIKRILKFMSEFNGRLLSFRKDRSVDRSKSWGIVPSVYYPDIIGGSLEPLYTERALAEMHADIRVGLGHLEAPGAPLT